MNIPDIGATGIIVTVILAFAVIGFLKGLIRTVLAVVCLGLAGYAAFWGHEHATDLTGSWVSGSGEWMPKIIAVVTGIIVFVLCRAMLNFLVDPFNRSKAGKHIGFGLPAAFLSICAGLGILWLACAGIRYGGSLAELRLTRHQILDASPSRADTYAAPLMVQAKHALDASSIGKWHRSTDPFYIPGRLTLCKVLVMYHHPQTRRDLLNNPVTNTLLNHPEFLKLAYRNDIQDLTSSGHLRELFTAPAVKKTLTRPELMILLGKVETMPPGAIYAQHEQ